MKSIVLQSMWLKDILLILVNAFVVENLGHQTDRQTAGRQTVSLLTYRRSDRKTARRMDGQTDEQKHKASMVGLYGYFAMSVTLTLRPTKSLSIRIHAEFQSKYFILWMWTFPDAVDRKCRIRISFFN